MPFLRSSASERRSVVSHSFTPEHDLGGARTTPTPLSTRRPPRQTTNIAISALVIARMLISMIPNTNCTTQPI